MDDTLAGRRAKDSQELEKARELVEWLLERADERAARGHVSAAMILRIAAQKVRDFFQPPLG